ncbi:MULTISPECIES: aldehyde dehydrogenase family protein [unclassified Oceanobacter]|jgi:phenylacetaldehyde dehydrogenase|uniref:aldehyde dehydrogenase family protein n=2 Tax=Gammaproteobacteria TaxID=1236 RepID=UPI0026E404CC|nr:MULTISPECIES: aldehyde dehydrogenase family protein [unclassified Oceanobacter]MDO6683256.1 aldehyde dehydrogenase family protein [Oceanobacter sp. 5_MG-2023]MDP2504179.1 aldehyde dehydrogenase family protein [Oceanobacter sp. 3_MG-2023]MDP2546617.1 aldehyde dehydrogenase family protein [Oceanobacter sp. 4_MG-2023]MDP2610224.1 aldehyde dehydrogenase family protein [Oceanobacter sp. 1_MG-2023]MDP2613490.1 aldehyde dehydrogenase family protein [Oceanobacter sp. 2_MG-2023]
MSDIQLLPETLAFLERQHGQFIDGSAVAPAAGTEVIDITNPATEQVIGQVTSASTDQLNQAVDNAKACFKSTWANFNPYARGQLLNKLADLIEANAEQIAQLETLSSGKSINLSRMFEAQQSAIFLRYYAGWTTKITGDTLQPSFPSMAGEQYSAFTRREPIGVVAAIVPWNFPLMIAVWKLGAALACGCTVVLKPSEFTPLTCLRLAELAKEAGLPDGTLNVINGKGDVGAQLIQHPDIAKVSFTGSVPTGKKVNLTAAADLTRCTLELGGKNTAALLKDADIDRAVGGLLQTGYIHQGQVCAAPERVYVHASRLDELTAKLGGALSAAPMGSPLDEQVVFGPISNKPQYEKVCHYLDIANQESRILTGGKAVPGPVNGKGYFVQPTIVQVNSANDTLMQEETFGPILSFMAYEEEDELISLINNTPYGLGTSLWTNNLSATMRMIPQIESGTVWVNLHTMVDPAVPFGGVKHSGIGREFGSAFIDEYTETKSVIMAY